MTPKVSTSKRQRIIFQISQYTKPATAASKIRAKFGDDMVDRLDRVMRGRQGARTDLLDNVQEVHEAPTGNTKDAGLRRLRKDRQDLHQRVITAPPAP